MEVAALQASGDQVAANGEFSLHASGLPVGTFGFYFLGDGTQSAMPMGSQGIVYVGGNVGRFNRPSLNEILLSSASGTASLSVDLSAVPTGTGTAALTAGDTRYFQLWHRDINPMQTSNFTRAIGVTFE